MDNDLYIISFWILSVFIFNFFLKNIHKLKKLKFIWPTTNIEEWAIITGGTDGIGREFVDKLWMYGYNIIVISRSEEKLNKLTQKFGETRFKTIVADFTKEGEEIYTKIKSEIGTRNVKILINNVGMVNRPMALGELKYNQISQIINCNISSTINMSRIVLKNNSTCTVLNISSLASKIPFPFYTLYSSSKLFIDKLTDDLAIEYPYAIIKRVNPYLIKTKMSKTKKGFFVPTPNKYVESIVEKGYFFPHFIVHCLFYFLKFLCPAMFSSIIKKYMISVIIKL